MKRPELLANELRELAGELTRRLRAESADQALSSSQTSVLARLFKTGPATIADLARAEYIKPQSMGVTIASLEEEGLVERTSDPDDARRWNASLTDAGKQAFLAGRAARQAWLSQAIADRLDATEQRLLVDATALLRKVLAL
jgi:DNA-binding MarR family transcriptional regulator